MPDVEHLRQRSSKFPSWGRLMDWFDRNLQEWVSSKKLVKMVSTRRGTTWRPRTTRPSGC